eukprot:COSAG04_NODE_66_length_29513_cov_208.948732_6_plen_1234_part_00
MLDGCQTGATGAKHRALSLEDSTSVVIKDTTITPTDASDSETASGAVNLPLDPQVLDLVTKGCETSPCESGNACSFHDFSLWCTPCAEDNQYSVDGRACTQCAPGKQPNEEKSDCVECDGDDEYSVAGKCLQCGSGTQPAWEPGKRTGATACAGVYRCPRGHECPEEKVKCLNIHDCLACQAGKTSSDGGECKNCTFPQIHSLDNSECASCTAGKGPNQARTACTSCTGIDYSTFGVCQPCLAGSQPDVGHTKCDTPNKCLQGDYCPNLDGCNNDVAGSPGACENCPPGRWNEDGGVGAAGVRVGMLQACYACDTISEAAPTRRSCDTCGNGKEPFVEEPSHDHSHCVDCTGTNFSDNGFPCQVCEWPKIVGTQQDPDDRLPRNGHTKCEKCQAGEGPAGCKEVGGVTTCSGGCAPCSGNQHADGGQTGTCSDCPVGKIATADHQFCKDCPEHQTYVPGVSSVTGKCACGTTGGKRSSGFYNVSEWGLIVCFLDGYQESDISSAYQEWLETEKAVHMENADHHAECLECPPCADCSQGYPVLRQGYKAETAMAGGPEGDSFHDELMTVQRDGQRFSYAFLCDEENAISPRAAALFGYDTTELANDRCPPKPMTKDVAPSQCPLGYEGVFCESCIANTTAPYDIYHRAKNQTCVKCEDAYDVARIGGAGGLALLCLGFAIYRCVTTRKKVTKRRKQLATEMQASGADDQDGGDADGDGDGAKTSDVDLSKFEEDKYFEDEDEGCCGSIRRACCCKKDTVADIYRACKVPVRTIVTYMQVTGQLGRVYHTQYPPMVSDFLSAITPLQDFFSIVFSAECAHLGGFANKWKMRVFGYPVLLLSLAILEFLHAWLFSKLTRQMKAWKKIGCSEAASTFLQRVLLAIFLVYPSVVNICFSALNCRHVSPTVRVLADDDRIFCGTANERVFSSIPVSLSTASVVVIGLFGVGIPLGFGFKICWKDRQKEREVSEADVDSIRNSVYREEDHHKFGADDRRLARATIRQVLELDRYSFLTYAYSPLCPFWESIDLIRKLCLVGLVVLVGRGSEAQIAAGNAISFGFFAAHMKVWPMKTNYDNYLRAACEVHVCMSITVAFVLKGDLSHEIVHRDFYDWVLVISGGCCVGLAGFLCVWMKMKQLRQMQRAAVQNKDTPEKAAYMRFKAGLSNPKDRKVLKEYLQRGGSASDSASASFGEASDGSFDEPAGEAQAPPPHRDRPQPEPEPEPHHGNDLEEPLFSS